MERQSEREFLCATSLTSIRSTVPVVKRRACVFPRLQTVHVGHPRRHGSRGGEQDVRQSPAAQRDFDHDRHPHVQPKRNGHL